MGGFQVRRQPPREPATGPASGLGSFPTSAGWRGTLVRPDGGSPDSRRSAHTREAATVRLPQRRLRSCIRRPAPPPVRAVFAMAARRRVFRRRPSADRSPSASAVAELRSNGFRPFAGRLVLLYRHSRLSVATAPPFPVADRFLRARRYNRIASLTSSGCIGSAVMKAVRRVASAAVRSLGGRSVTTTSSRSGNRYHSWIELLRQELRPASHAGAESAGSGHLGAVGGRGRRVPARARGYGLRMHTRVTGIVIEDDHILLLDQDTDGPRSWSLPGGKVEDGSPSPRRWCARCAR